jgi:hypothetical protein
MIRVELIDPKIAKTRVASTVQDLHAREAAKSGPVAT